MYCKECGNQIANDSKFCPSCGKLQGREVVSNPGNSNADILQLKDEIKKLRQEEFYRRQSKSKSTALLLLIFLGGLGAHRFYTGKTGTGLLMLLFFYPSAIIFFATRDIEEISAISGRGLSEIGSTFQIISAILSAIFAIWLLIDLIRIINGSFIEQKNVFGYREQEEEYSCLSILIIFLMIIVIVVAIVFAII